MRVPTPREPDLPGQMTLDGVGLLEQDPDTAPLCRCGQRARGNVPATDLWPAHYCRQCSGDHCEIRRHLDRG